MRRRRWLGALSGFALLASAGLWFACSLSHAPEPAPPPLVTPPPLAAGATPTSIQKWAAALQPAPVVAFFDGLFHRVGVRVTDTGEAFTAVHAGDRILFSDELDESHVDFTVEITTAQVDRMLGHLAAGRLDEGARFRIMAVLATPATRAMLARPVIRSERLRELLYWIGDAEPRMQVVLTPPPGEPEVGHTIERVGAVTTVTAGLHGAVDHVYRLSVDDAVEFQRRMIAARSADSLLTWLQFARWYGALRARVVEPVGPKQG